MRPPPPLLTSGRPSEAGGLAVPAQKVRELARGRNLQPSRKSPLRCARGDKAARAGVGIVPSSWTMPCNQKPKIRTEKNSRGGVFFLTLIFERR